MYFFYIFALLPVLIGCVLWYKNKQIILQEWLIGSGIAILTAFIFNLIALGVIRGKTSDIETWSGYVTQVEYHPKWIEEWIQIHVESYQCGTDKDGSPRYCTRTYTTIEHDTHPEHWEAKRYFGEYEDSIDIDFSLYQEIKQLFGGQIIDGGKQIYWHGGSFDGGDNNIYATPNNTRFIYPAVITKNFKNKIKATPNLFQFAKIPTNISVYPYPQHPAWNNSDRLLGTAATLINKFKFDQFNAILGPIKRVNVIFVGYTDSDSIFGEYQQAAWLGGKKNDLVIVFGGGNTNAPAKWVKCFGWTERELVKKNLETLLLTQPINTDILNKVTEEIRAHYVIKDWKKFDYIKIQPPAIVYVIYVILVLIVQTGLYIYFHKNNLTF